MRRSTPSQKRAAAEPAWLETSPAEDVHHFVEMALVERLGPLGYKLHTARSRNELVATDFRLFVKDAAREMTRGVLRPDRRARGFAERAMDVPYAGHDAHAARAAAAVFAFFAGACRGVLSRSGASGSRAAMADACPLGSGALGGLAHFRLDREALARELGFARAHGE